VQEQKAITGEAEEKKHTNNDSDTSRPATAPPATHTHTHNHTTGVELEVATILASATEQSRREERAGGGKGVKDGGVEAEGVA